MKDISFYFHIPYCRNKCIYCDFYSGGARIADWSGLFNAFLNELSSREEEWNGEHVISIYFGGGTPSLMPPQKLHDLMRDITHLIGSDNISKDCEITIEVNPEDVIPDAIEKWKEAGINRISVGIQTFNDKELSLIGRKHSGSEALNALRLLQKTFGNISVDLIFGLPGQTLKDLNDDIDTILTLHPQHISVYSLMYEDGTALTQLRKIGKIQPVDDNLAAEMFKDIVRRLEQAGYRRYEISNYSIPGSESRHNMGYWMGRKYIGIGPAAHSYDGDALRSYNPADIKKYLERYSHAGDITSNKAKSRQEAYNYYSHIEELSVIQKMEERIMLRLRMREGIDLRQYKEEFGNSELQNLLTRGRKYINIGSLILDKNHLYLADEAVLYSDSII
ncbi:MAG: radical SAM family heme chaperone HemW, partial [Muribaculaceae bacterium]|nr:radical SAM family heme chaperone HemW [Muribaculaceae bacterium]